PELPETGDLSHEQRKSQKGSDDEQAVGDPCNVIGYRPSGQRCHSRDETAGRERQFCAEVQSRTPGFGECLVNDGGSHAGWPSLLRNPYGTAYSTPGECQCQAASQPPPAWLVDA